MLTAAVLDWAGTANRIEVSPFEFERLVTLFTYVSVFVNNIPVHGAGDYRNLGLNVLQLLGRLLPLRNFGL